MVAATRKSSAEKTRAYRERMRAKGMKQVTIWVPDRKSPEYLAEARRQSRAVASSPHAADDQAFVDSLSEWIFEE